MMVSTAAHVIALFAFNQKPPVAISQAIDDYIPVALEAPPPLELDEPEPVMGDEPVTIDAAAYVPTQVDTPSATINSVFLQQIDVSSLKPKLDVGAAQVMTIPPTSARRGDSVASALKNVFSLSDLDKIPEPLFQPSPIFPPALKRDVSRARLLVEFVVQTNGKVTEVRVLSASHAGFDEAAITALSRWQFRPGIRQGKKVNTRMQVPLDFNVDDGG